MFNIGVCFLLFLTRSLVAFDTNITGPGEVGVGTTYNVTCTLASFIGTFFRNNISVTNTFIKDISGRCYVTNSAKYKCSFKSISSYYKEFQLEVPTDSDDAGETEWYCSYPDGKSNTIFVDVFQPTGNDTTGYQNFKWSDTYIALIVCSSLMVLIVLLAVLVFYIIKACKLNKIQQKTEQTSGQPEMIIYNNSLYKSQESVNETSSMINIPSSTDPSHPTSPLPQKDYEDIYDRIPDIRNSLTESREDLEVSHGPTTESDPQKIYTKAIISCDLSTSQV